MGKKDTFRLLAISFLAFVVSSTLQAEDGDSPSVESKLRAVKKTIRDGFLDEGLRLLGIIGNEEPTAFHDVYRLTAKILKFKEQFRDIYLKLREAVLVKEDYTLGLSLIGELEDLDKEPGEKAKQRIAAARLLVEDLYHQQVFKEIWQQGDIYLRQGKYVQASEHYLDKLLNSAYAKDFKRSHAYSGEAKTKSWRAIGQLKEAVEAFVEEGRTSQKAYATMLESVRKAEPDQLNNLMMTLLARHSRILNESERVVEVQDEIKEQIEVMRQLSKDGRPPPYLVATDVVIGNSRRGVLGAMTLSSHDRLKGFAETLRKGLHASLSVRENKDASPNHRTTAYAQAGIQVAQRALSLLQKEELGRPKDPVTEYYEDVLKEGQLVVFGKEYLEEALTIEQDLEEFNSTGVTLDSLEEEELQKILAKKERSEEILREVKEGREAMEGLHVEVRKGLAPYYVGLLLKLSPIVEKARELAETRSQQWMVKRKKFVDEAVGELSEKIVRAKRLLEGETKTIDKGNGVTETIVSVYPDETLSLAEEVQAKTREVQEEVEEFLQIVSRLDQKESHFYKEGEELKRRLGTLPEETEQLQARATENIRLADSYQERGEAELSAAQESIKREDLDGGIARLRDAMVAFSNAFARRENEPLRRRVASRKRSLEETLTLIKRGRVIRHVRDKIKTGKDLFTRKLFSQSEEMFREAKIEWDAVHIEENPEITHWMGLLHNVTLLSGEGEVQETDPLYREVSQLINLASDNLAGGRYLINQGRKKEGEVRLERARRNIEQILAMFPLNEAASILKIKIIEARDPVGFRSTIAKRLASAQKQLFSRSQTAYTELKALAATFPRYPRINDILFDAEVKLGLRIPPPTPQEVAESEELYQRAYNIVATNKRAQYPLALTQLNRAIQLNPDNDKFVLLKDRIAVDVTGESVALALSPEREKKLSDARQKFIAGDLYEAYAIVKNLLEEDQALAHYPPLAELKRRLESEF